MNSIKLYEVVSATCIHKGVGEVKGVVYEIHKGELTVMTTQGRGYTCSLKTARVIPDGELNDALRRLSESYQPLRDEKKV